MANSVSYDTSGNSNPASANPVTVSVTIGNNANRDLIVAVGYQGGGTAASAVTYNGTSMSLIQSTPDNNGSYTIWHMHAPSTGTHNISITGFTAGHGNVPVLWWSLYGTDQTITPASVNARSSANPATTSITPSLAGGIVVGFLGESSNITLVAPTTHLIDRSNGGGGSVLSGADSDVTANTNAVSITSGANGGGSVLALFGVSVTPPPVPSGAFLTFM